MANPKRPRLKLGTQRPSAIPLAAPQTNSTTSNVLATPTRLSELHHRNLRRCLCGRSSGRMAQSLFLQHTELLHALYLHGRAKKLAENPVAGPCVSL